jgi:recombination protein RecR
LSNCVFLQKKTVSEFASNLLETAVNELSRLPGIGKKTALRLALHLLREEQIRTDSLSRSLMRMRSEIHFCKRCHNISDSDVCTICSNPRRDENTICVVEDMRDVMAIERTASFNGLYHVLGGVISPVEGIGPNQLNIASLSSRMGEEPVREVILALPATIEGDTTSYYIYKQLIPFSVRVTTIAKGVAIGDALEYADEVTLGRSILNRMLFESN